MNLGFIGGYTFRFQSPPIPPAAANNDTVTGISGVIGGTNVLNVLGNDEIKGDPATPANSTLSLVSSISSRLSFDTSTGQVSVLPGTRTGTYSFTYQICDANDSGDCDTAIASIGVIVPVSNGQTCPVGQGNLVLNPSFSSGFANWSQSGANANFLNVGCYTGNPSGTSFTSVVNEVSNNTSGSLSQFVPRSISRSGDGVLRFDYGWNNGSPGGGSSIIVSVAGTDVLLLASDNTNDNTTPGDFTFLNGASGSIGGEAFGVNATGKLPIGQFLAWDLYGVSVNLPAALADSGDVEFRYINQTDDWAIDNVILCNILIAEVEVTKISSTFTPNDFLIPFSDVIYTINFQNTGDLNIDADSVFVVDTLPDDLTFFNGDYNGAAPGTNVAGFTQTGSSLTFSEASDLAFSSQVAAPTSFAQCTYTPISGYDGNVRHICINPKGVFETGPAPPEFTLEFRTRIN